jgi:anti-sigma factor RsiW
MTTPIDPIVDADLDAYVDEQLDVGRRIEVEAYLSTHPDKAARIMSDLRTRDELRLALAGAPRMTRPATNDAARRLERGLTQRRLLGKMRRIAAVGLFVAAGWFANSTLGPLTITEVVASAPPPAYVEEAVMAHRTTQVRSAMPSQPEVPEYDPEEIRAATAIVMPELPADWLVTDVQVFPSKFGPSVEMAIQTDDYETLSLFAVRPGSFDVVRATSVHNAEITAAYWQIGDVAYALVTKANARDLDRAAIALADTLY